MHMHIKIANYFSVAVLCYVADIVWSVSLYVCMPIHLLKLRKSVTVDERGWGDEGRWQACSPVMVVQGCHPRKLFNSIHVGSSLCNLVHFYDIRSSEVGRKFRAFLCYF